MSDFFDQWDRWLEQLPSNRRVEAGGADDASNDPERERSGGGPDSPGVAEEPTKS